MEHRSAVSALTIRGVPELTETTIPWVGRLADSIGVPSLEGLLAPAGRSSPSRWAGDLDPVLGAAGRGSPAGDPLALWTSVAMLLMRYSGADSVVFAVEYGSDWLPLSVPFSETST